MPETGEYLDFFSVQFELNGEKLSLRTEQSETARELASTLTNNRNVERATVYDHERDRQIAVVYAENRG